MGITRYIYQSRALHDWQTWTLVALNFTTLVITVINYVYLCKKMPIAHHPMPKSPNPQLKHITSAPFNITATKLHWKHVIIAGFLCHTLRSTISISIHLDIPWVRHHGCNCTFAFMNMMIVSCDGMSVIRFYLEPRED
eukprot:253043_1